MLHDVALVARVGTRKDHHINGAEMAEAMLAKYNYLQEKIARVKSCVLNHCSGRNGTNIEEICVADADILAHFDNIPMIFSNILQGGASDGITLPILRSTLKESFEADYSDLSERTQQDFRERYELICRMVLGC